jgi:hypothetical protein
MSKDYLNKKIGDHVFIQQVECVIVERKVSCDGCFFAKSVQGVILCEKADWIGSCCKFDRRDRKNVKFQRLNN